VTPTKTVERSASKLCTKCKAEPRQKGQRWGRKCRTAYMDAQRKTDPMPKSRKLSTLTPDPRNANAGTSKGRKALDRSVSDLGFGRSILIDATDTVIAGNKTMEAALKRNPDQKIRVIETDGTELIAVKRTDLTLATDAVAQKLALADNRVAELSLDWDPGVLAGLADTLDLSDLFSTKELSALIASVRPPTTANDEAPDLPAVAKTKLGDVYTLGNHRLVCGDSTQIAVVSLALAGRAADCVWTDPPDNIGYEGGPSLVREAITNDALSVPAFTGFMRKVYENCSASLRPGGGIYVAHSDSFGHIFRQTMIDSGLAIRQVLVWAKDQQTFGRQDYQWQHEPILYGWKPGAAHNWYSDRSQSTLLQFERPKRSKVHPTMKPVGLVQYLIENSTKAGEIVLDLFGGSGTTMMACEASNRISCLVELDPKYCDVIVSRWQEATSRTAELIRG
jgi:DNA modification methylase